MCQFIDANQTRCLYLAPLGGRYCFGHELPLPKCQVIGCEEPPSKGRTLAPLNQQWRMCCRAHHAQLLEWRKRPCNSDKFWYEWLREIYHPQTSFNFDAKKKRRTKPRALDVTTLDVTTQSVRESFGETFDLEWSE